MSETPDYYVYAVCGTKDHSLFIDYVCESLYLHEIELMQKINFCQHQPLQEWLMLQQPKISELFEIECVSSKALAEEAVSFWRAYFGSLGEVIIDSEHVCDIFSA